MRRLLPPLAALLLVLPALSGVAAAQPVGLAGSVTDAAGRPVAGAVVTLVTAAAPDTPATQATAGADGAWSAAPADGTYHVHAADPTSAHADAWWDGRGEPRDTVQVTGGSGPQDVVLALPVGGGVAGRVTGPAGPLAGALVRVARTPFSPVEGETDAEGRYRLDGLRAGAHVLEVRTADTAVGGADEPVTVRAGERTTVDVVLRRVPVGVQRVSGADRVATAVEASRTGFPSAETVVVAAAGAFPDALSASPLAATLGGPLLLVGPRLTSNVAAELERLGAQEAVIVGAVAAVPLVVQDELTRLGLSVRRIAGDSRFDTAALIAREVGGDAGRAIVVSGLEFADALSVAPMAAAERIPILLTAPAELNGDTARALADLGVDETLVVGGTAAVSDAVLQALPAATRVSGRTRYETSLAVAQHWLDRGMRLETVSIATGRDFPDALAAGPVAGLARGPLLLVDGRDAATPAGTYAWLAEHRAAIDGAYAFGGTGVLTDAVLARLRQAIGAGS